ncbi:hypothetical protein ACQUFY_24930 (plasmid) [Robbsia andropogonis]|uniref:hypothetical protein n=1 Tax=Robbsia andropogonis TaxID=28092 RepID=UPI003D2228B3
MIGKLPQYSTYAFKKFLPGRVAIQVAFKQPITGDVEKAKQYPPLAQQVQKVTVGPLHGLADRLPPGKRFVQSSRFHSQFKNEVVSAKPLGSMRPEDRASEGGATHYFKQTEAYRYEDLLSPSLVQAQQKEFLSRKITNEPHPGVPYSESEATPRKKHASIFFAEEIYRESISKAMNVLMSNEKEIQSTEKDLSVVSNSIHLNDEKKLEIKRRLYVGHVVPLINDAKKQIIELSEKVNDFFDRHDFYGVEKSKAVAFQRTAKFLLDEKLADVEKLGLHFRESVN